MDPRTQLLAEIDAFLAARSMAESTFGRLAVNDGKFVSRLRGRGNITWATADRVRAFIKTQSEAASKPQDSAGAQTAAGAA